MGYRPAKDAEQRLRELAQAQGGYFTSQQAAVAGYGYSHLAYHVQAGGIERVLQGLYRLPTVAISPHDDLIRLALWSRDRAQKPQAVASHATALTVHELTLLLPDKTHLTVPRSFTKKAPLGCVLHRGELAPEDIEAREGYSVTTPLRTLLDAARAPDVPHEEFERAVKAALERGLTTEPALAETFARAGLDTKVLRGLSSAKGKRR